MISLSMITLIGAYCLSKLSINLVNLSAAVHILVMPTIYVTFSFPEAIDNINIMITLYMITLIDTYCLSKLSVNLVNFNVAVHDVLVATNYLYDIKFCK
jgi:hypothetical protein